MGVLKRIFKNIHLEVISAVQRHPAHHRRLPRSKVQAGQAVIGAVRLRLVVDVKVEGQAAEVEGEGVLGGVVDGRMRASDEFSICSIDGRISGVLIVEVKPAVMQANQQNKFSPIIAPFRSPDPCSGPARA